MNTVSDPKFFVPVIRDFTRLFQGYGLNEQEAKALNSWIQQTSFFPNNREQLHALEIALDTHRGEDSYEDLSGYLRVGREYRKLRIHLNPQHYSVILKKTVGYTIKDDFHKFIDEIVIEGEGRFL